MISQWIDPSDSDLDSFAGQDTTIGLDAREWAVLLVCTLLIAAIVAMSG